MNQYHLTLLGFEVLSTDFQNRYRVWDEPKDTFKTSFSSVNSFDSGLNIALVDDEENGLFLGYSVRKAAVMEHAEPHYHFMKKGIDSGAYSRSMKKARDRLHFLSGKMPEVSLRLIAADPSMDLRSINFMQDSRLHMFLTDDVLGKTDVYPTQKPSMPDVELGRAEQPVPQGANEDQLDMFL